jgi:DNA-binding CsgD family transcriptional regulator
VGRDAEIAAALNAAAERPGLLVVVAATWVGATRFAAQLAARLEADGAIAVSLGKGVTLSDRMAAGLTRADLRPDPVTASRLRPYVALLGDIESDTFDEAQQIGHTLTGAQGLLIACMREIPIGAAFVELDPLDDEAARAIVAEAAPAIGDVTQARVLQLSAGRPGVLVALAQANRRPVADEMPLKIPSTLVRALQPAIDAIDPIHLDVARWTAVMGGVFEPSDLVRLTGRTEDRCAAILDGLVVSGIVEELPPPGPVRLEFADPLMADALREGTPPSDLRRRHTAVLNARRARGDDATELVQYAIGTAEPREVVGLSLRAAALARERGAPAQALVHAERALTWSERHRPEPELLEAMLEQGLALAGLGQWEQVAPVLGEVIRRQRRAGNEGAAVRAATEWARVRWYAGDRSGAFELIEANVSERDGPLAERAKALTQAAMFAANAGRHTDALEWATRARAEATVCDDHLTAILALNAMGLSTVRSTANPEGLSYFREGLQEARANGLLRQAAVTLNNESVSLLMLGMVRQAADRAQEGLDLVETNDIPEIDAPLTHNLAEALAAMGRLRGARRLALRSQEAFAVLGMWSDMPLEGVLAWIDFAEGKVPEALTALRAVSTSDDEAATIEHMGSIAAYHVHVAHAAGEFDEAQSVARTAIGYWRDTEDRVDALGLLGAACEVLPAAEAKPVLAGLQIAADAGAPLAAALIPYAQAWSARSASAKAAAFREASTLFAQTDMAWWAARTLMLAGEAAGKTPEAVADLLEARRMFREMDAPGWRSRCEAALRARGHKFVMASQHRENAGLTDREIQVLEEVALGLSNQLIADRLFISERTVGRHLERIFAKLNVLSRIAAVTAGVERGLVTEVADQVSTESSGGSGALSELASAETTATP